MKATAEFWINRAGAVALLVLSVAGCMPGGSDRMALRNEPPVLLADEPTGNLVTKSSVEVMELFTELSHEGVTIVMVTHEDDIAAYAKRHLVMKDGKLV